MNSMEIEDKIKDIGHRYVALVKEMAEALAKLPVYQKIVLTDMSSGERYIGIIKRIKGTRFLFIEDITRNRFEFSVNQLVLDNVYFGDANETQLLIEYFDKKPKNRKKG